MNVVEIKGQAGSGKTHLLDLIAASEKRPMVNEHFQTFKTIERLMNHVQSSGAQVVLLDEVPADKVQSLVSELRALHGNTGYAFIAIQG